MTPMQWFAVGLIVATCGASREWRSVGFRLMVIWVVVMLTTWVIERLFC